MAMSDFNMPPKEVDPVYWIIAKGKYPKMIMILTKKIFGSIKVANTVMDESKKLTPTTYKENSKVSGKLYLIFLKNNHT